MLKQLFLKYRELLIYAIALALMLFLLKSLEVRFLVFSHSFELYIGAIAILFTSLGIWLALKLTKPKKEMVFIEKEVYVANPAFVLNEAELNKMGISKRELEVLQLMARGLSNQEIASNLFVSMNTVKTHTSNLFEKLDVKRRTQAVERAKRLNIIP